MASGMTKTQLVRHLAEKIEVNNKTAAAFLENLTDTAVKETKKNGIFVIPGLGRLVKAHRKARMGRNPQTGEPHPDQSQDRSEVPRRQGHQGRDRPQEVVLVFWFVRRPAEKPAFGVVWPVCGAGALARRF
jgi:DNA-binding protein HU-beta